MMQTSLFGKHPSSSEYLYLGENSNFTYSIINWIKSGYEALLKKRLSYVSDKTHSFYFFNKESNIFVCGTLSMSKDAMGRAYPLVILVTFKHSFSLKFFQAIWKKNIDILKKEQSLAELEHTLADFDIDEVKNGDDGHYREVDKTVLCAFIGEDLAEVKLFDKALQVDDFITLMR